MSVNLRQRKSERREKLRKRESKGERCTEKGDRDREEKGDK